MTQKRYAKTARGFDYLAPLYHILTRMVYGPTLHNAQTVYLRELEQHGNPAIENILIIGGGNGDFLSALQTAFPMAGITNVDISPRMTALSRRRANRTVRFIIGTLDDVEWCTEMKKFDLVCTHFYLDMFPPERLGQHVTIIEKYLRPNGYWLYSDFCLPRRPRFWRVYCQGLTALMFFFFRTFCAVEGNTLVCLKTAGLLDRYQTLDRKTFYGGFIEACLFKRRG